VISHSLAIVAGTCLFASSLASVPPVDEVKDVMTGDQDAAPSPAPAGAAAVETSFLRVVETPGESIALEVAAWKFGPREGDGPAVILVGVAHIGDASLYRNLQQILNSCDLVLYESVKPAGAKRPTGDDDDSRRASTQASLTFIAQTIGTYRESVGEYPASIENLLVGLNTVDPRLAQWVELASVDAWDQPIAFQRFQDGHAFLLTSYGTDRAEGGEGAAADIVVHSDMAIPRDPLSSDDGLQAQLAEALGLEFQLDAIDYGQQNWRCSDMTEDDFAAALAAKGYDFVELGGTLAGSSLPAKVVKVLLRVAKFLDAFMDGRVSDTFKVMMIEVLGDESITESAMNSQFGEGFADVIIGQRNQVVMDDLRAVLDQGGGDAAGRPRSVGIFYGAAHMADFENRLAEQFDYVPKSAVWVPAITIDLRDSAMTEADIAQVRKLIRTSLGGMRP